MTMIEPQTELSFVDSASGTELVSISFTSKPIRVAPAETEPPELAPAEEFEFGSLSFEALHSPAPVDASHELVSEIESIPNKMAFKIGEAAEMVGVKQYVLRYWETEFEMLRPRKSKNNQRVFSRRDVETAMMIKKLLYEDRFSIEGARAALRHLKMQVKEHVARAAAPVVADAAASGVAHDSLNLALSEKIGSTVQSSEAHEAPSASVDFNLLSNAIDSLRDILDDIRGLKTALSAD
jgi:DNA-binding transcriptional MerR regulator